jgi:hypothetical protein
LKLSRNTGMVTTGVARDLTKDLHDAYTELLSAQCAADRLKRNHHLESIVKGEPEKLRSMLATARTLCEYYSKLGKSVGK